MTLIRLLNKLLATEKPGNDAVSIRTLDGDSIEKRRLYERALNGAATEQKRVVDEYKKKFEYQG